MKLFLLLIFLTTNAFALDECFTYIKDEKLVSRGSCKTQYSPQSTFKIAIALMGYDSGILTDQTHPEVPYKKEYPAWIESWKSPHNPSSWMKNSVVWYSQYVTKKLGMVKFKKYLQQFDYGDRHVSSLTGSWLTSTLKISPEEQVKFLERMLKHKLGIKNEAYTYTKDILFLEELNDGWKLYGKTGTGDLVNADGSKNKLLERGWFSGWVEKGDKKIIFTQYLEVKNDKSKKGFAYVASKNAKELALISVGNLIKK